MFNYASVEFPNTTVGPAFVYDMRFYQNKYEHEVAVIQFRDWGTEYDVIESGSPIKFTLTKDGTGRVFYGYVHHVNVDRTPGSFMSEVVAVSASMIMKNQSQNIYKGLSADAVVKAIASKYKFACFSVPHPRIYPQISQTGHTDWELMVRLAKQSGYSLRTQNTELYFQPMLYEYTSKRSEAPYFVMREANNPSGSTIYSFNASVGESLEFDGEEKAAVAVSGLDFASQSGMSITKQLRAKNTKFKTAVEFFDRFDTHTVATDATVAKYEAEAADNRNVFPYRATAEVAGDASLRPDLPVYLDGLGGYYTGYWTILGTEHRIVEEERNSHSYTTILHLGTDSLGIASTWTDGALITKPAAQRSRTVISGVRQTNVVPATSLLSTSPNLGPQSVGKFGVASNRLGPKKAGPIWVSKTPTLNPVSTTSKSPQSSRLLTKIPAIL